MIMIGKKYKFIQQERELIQKKFDNILYFEGLDVSVLNELIGKENVKLIVLNLRVSPSSELVKYLTELSVEKNIRFTTLEHFMEEYLMKCYIPKEFQDLHWLEDIKQYSKWQYAQKKLMDYVGVTLLFLFSLPVMLMCKKKIREQSPGPVIFKQARIGHADHSFECVKFRSMHDDAERSGAQFAEENDPRVFPWGETMRKARFDELPQMVNILKGEMHLIGPRPERKIWTDQFKKSIPYYNERHLVAPGITGWAQVMYPYGATEEDARQKLMYDLYYIKYWNMLLDLKIVYLTAKTVIGKRGV